MAMLIRKLDGGIIEIYPFVDDAELTKHNFFNGGRVEIFPEWARATLDGKRVRYEDRCYTRDSWREYSTRLNAAMEKAFELESEPTN